LDVILMARRSRHYAGTRYLKRGLSVHGKVANDCEVEQIIQTEGQSAPYRFCSYLQMRGSIPTYWYQETSVTMPKPPILINRVDPEYLATQEHFADMFRRYRSPIIVLDLVKQHEKRPRESIIGRELRQAVSVLNESIVEEHKIRYLALDYSRITSISKGKFTKLKASKSRLMTLKDKAHPNAMTAVGDEWALMEKSLARKATQTGIEDVPLDVAKAPAATLTNFDDARKDFVPNTMISSGADGIAIENIADFNAVESRIDVLKELEDIANLTLHETGFFCRYDICFLLPLRIIKCTCCHNAVIFAFWIECNPSSQQPMFRSTVLPRLLLFASISLGVLSNMAFCEPIVLIASIEPTVGNLLSPCAF
jgi:hypothetical protein